MTRSRNCGGFSKYKEFILICLWKPSFLHSFVQFYYMTASQKNTIHLSLQFCSRGLNTFKMHCTLVEVNTAVLSGTHTQESENLDFFLVGGVTDYTLTCFPHYPTVILHLVSRTSQDYSSSVLGRKQVGRNKASTVSPSNLINPRWTQLLGRLQAL